MKQVEVTQADLQLARDIGFETWRNRQVRYRKLHIPYGQHMNDWFARMQHSYESAWDDDEGEVQSALLAIQRTRLASRADILEEAAALVENWNGETRDGDTFIIAAAIRNLKGAPMNKDELEICDECGDPLGLTPIYDEEECTQLCSPDCRDRWDADGALAKEQDNAG